MLNRWSFVVLSAGVLAGYVLRDQPVVAQVDPLPFNVGDEVTFYYNERTADTTCVVSEIHGAWARCAPSDRIAFGRQDAQNWHHMNWVIQVRRTAK